MRLDTVYFTENWKFIIENTVVKYFLLLKFTVHPQFALGWSMNSAMDQPKNATYSKRKHKKPYPNGALGDLSTSILSLSLHGT